MIIDHLTLSLRYFCNASCKPLAAKLLQCFFFFGRPPSSFAMISWLMFIASFMVFPKANSVITLEVAIDVAHPKV